MKRKLERRYIDPEIRIDGAGNTVSGYGAVFNQWSQQIGFFKEKIKPGAFSKTIQENDVRSLFNHDPNLILARSGNGSLKLKEDSHGLSYEFALTDTSYSQDLKINIEENLVTENSFGFETIKESWNAKHDERTLLEVKLYDVGPVTHAAYPQTSLSMRSQQENEEREKRIRHVRIFAATTLN